MATQTRSTNCENGIGFPFNGEKLLGKKTEGVVKPRKPLQDLSCKNSENMGPGKAALVAKKNGGRRALGDLTNSSKLVRRGDAPPARKNSSLKLASVVEKEEVVLNTVDEGFLYDHKKCVKAQTDTMDKDYFLEIVGLGKDCSTPVLPIRFPKELDLGFRLQSLATARLEFDHCRTPALTISRQLENPVVHRGEDFDELESSIEWVTFDQTFFGFFLASK